MTRPVSLGLLPSGPDPVGEGYVHRQPPARYIRHLATENKCDHGLFTGSLRASCGARKGACFSNRKDQMMPENGFVLDPHLENVGHLIGDFPLSHVFLLDDARFPWVMLVPRRANAAEILDLDAADRQALFDETMRAAEALRTVSRPDKLNIGALGNVVRQLHVHIVGRFQSDPAWPGPVWGHGERVPYPSHMVGPLMDRLAKELGL